MWLKLNKMKDFKLVLSTLFLFIITIFNAQIKNPVKFKFDVNPVGKDEYEAVLTGTIEDKWHIYSQDLPPDSGIPTEFKITSKFICIYFSVKKYLKLFWFFMLF